MQIRSYNRMASNFDVYLSHYNSIKFHAKPRKTMFQKAIRLWGVLAIVVVFCGFLTGFYSDSSVVSAQQSTKEFNPVKIGFVIRTEEVELNKKLQRLLCPTDKIGVFCQDAVDSDEEGYVAGIVGMLREQRKLDRVVFLIVKPYGEGYIYSSLVLDKANSVVDYTVDSALTLQVLTMKIQNVGGHNEQRKE